MAIVEAAHTFAPRDVIANLKVNDKKQVFQFMARQAFREHWTAGAADLHYIDEAGTISTTGVGAESPTRMSS